MNKTAIKNFAVWARKKLIADICYRAQLLFAARTFSRRHPPKGAGKRL